MSKSKNILVLLISTCLPLSADDASERRDIERELRLIAAASKALPPSASEIDAIRKFSGRELADMRRSLEIIRRNSERKTGNKLRIGAASPYKK